MGSIVQRNKEVARRKGVAAALTGVGGLMLSVTGAPVLGLPVIVLGAYFGYDWFMYRARHGMKF